MKLSVNRAPWVLVAIITFVCGCLSAPNDGESIRGGTSPLLLPHVLEVGEIVALRVDYWSDDATEIVDPPCLTVVYPPHDLEGIGLTALVDYRRDPTKGIWAPAFASGRVHDSNTHVRVGGGVGDERIDEGASALPGASAGSGRIEYCALWTLDPSHPTKRVEGRLLLMRQEGSHTSDVRIYINGTGWYGAEQMGNLFVCAVSDFPSIATAWAGPLLVGVEAVLDVHLGYPEGPEGAFVFVPRIGAEQAESAGGMLAASYAGPDGRWRMVGGSPPFATEWGRGDWSFRVPLDAEPLEGTTPVVFGVHFGSSVEPGTCPPA